MVDLKLRPRFALELPCEPATLVEALRECVDEADPPLDGRFDPAHCVLRLPPERRSFWSPELDLTFERLDPEAGPRHGILVRGLFAPRPPVWTGFAFVYALLATASLAAALYGFAQLGLGERPGAFALSAAALLLLGTVYGASYIGQGLAAGEMVALRRTLDAALERARARGRSPPRRSTAHDSEPPGTDRAFERAEPGDASVPGAFPVRQSPPGRAEPTSP